MAGDEFLAQTYDAAMRGYRAEIAEAESELAQAQLSYDPIAAADATRRMADIRTRANEYHRMASEHAASITAMPTPNKYGLTEAEQDAVRTCGVDEETYARNKAELARRKAAGFYPDGQH